MDPSLKLINHEPTRGDKLLDVLITNLDRFYKEAKNVPPINPDVVDKGKPSDQSGVFVNLISAVKQKIRKKFTKK